MLHAVLCCTVCMCMCMPRRAWDCAELHVRFVRNGPKIMSKLPCHFALVRDDFPGQRALFICSVQYLLGGAEKVIQLALPRVHAVNQLRRRRAILGDAIRQLADLDPLGGKLGRSLLHRLHEVHEVVLLNPDGGDGFVLAAPEQIDRPFHPDDRAVAGISKTQHSEDVKRAHHRNSSTNQPATHMASKK